MSHVLEEAIQFTADGLQLEGRLGVPESATHGAVICHPHPQYGGTMDNDVVSAVAEALQAAGVATLRFNFRGVGASEGRYGGGQAEANDARAAVDQLRTRASTTDVTLIGYSFGAIVALLAGHDHSGVSRLIAIATPVPMFDLDFLTACSRRKLFILGDRDQYCPLTAMHDRFATLPEPKTFMPIAGADHFFAGHEAAVADTVVRFVRERS
ncbi:MAG: alpha/beta fold hydrolase [Deltaproteobacteria bacterium]|nr:alpha/beta fold hydrolase [Deltaproteobacteria bacterium]MBI3390946.1 alpha/beta fold hydrolase [Deltaproteobacteria bacterium]